MNKYHVFAGENYYPRGFEDYKGSFVSLDAAFQYRDFLSNDPDVDWVDVAVTTAFGSLHHLHSWYKSQKHGWVESEI
jgi:hypothetical protein